MNWRLKQLINPINKLICKLFQLGSLLELLFKPSLGFAIFVNDVRINVGEVTNNGGQKTALARSTLANDAGKLSPLDFEVNVLESDNLIKG